MRPFYFDSQTPLSLLNQSRNAGERDYNIPQHTEIHFDTYRAYVAGELPDLEPWQFFHGHLEFRFKGLEKRYPKRKLVPFARRSDNDDVACFDAAQPSDNPSVIIIHDWASEGWENHGAYPDFLAWIELAKQEAKEWKDFWDKQ